jgi:hypothetical protein
LRDPLKSAIRIELEGRGLLPERTGYLDSNHIRSIYRELSFQFHPDRGGNVEAMKAINLFYERLTKR